MSEDAAPVPPGSEGRETRMYSIERLHELRHTLPTLKCDIKKFSKDAWKARILKPPVQENPNPFTASMLAPSVFPKVGRQRFAEIPDVRFHWKPPGKAASRGDHGPTRHRSSALSGSIDGSERRGRSQVLTISIPPPTATDADPGFERFLDTIPSPTNKRVTASGDVVPARPGSVSPVAAHRKPLPPIPVTTQQVPPLYVQTSPGLASLVYQPIGSVCALPGQQVDYPAAQQGLHSQYSVPISPEMVGHAFPAPMGMQAGYLDAQSLQTPFSNVTNVPRAPPPQQLVNETHGGQYGVIGVEGPMGTAGPFLVQPSFQGNIYLATWGAPEYSGYEFEPQSQFRGQPDSTARRHTVPDNGQTLPYTKQYNSGRPEERAIRDPAVVASAPRFPPPTSDSHMSLGTSPTKSVMGQKKLATNGVNPNRTGSDPSEGLPGAASAAKQAPATHSPTAVLRSADPDSSNQHTLSNIGISKTSVLSAGIQNTGVSSKDGNSKQEAKEQKGQKLPSEEMPNRTSSPNKPDRVKEYVADEAKLPHAHTAGAAAPNPSTLGTKKPGTVNQQPRLDNTANRGGSYVAKNSADKPKPRPVFSVNKYGGEKFLKSAPDVNLEITAKSEPVKIRFLPGNPWNSTLQYLRELEAKKPQTPPNELPKEPPATATDTQATRGPAATTEKQTFLREMLKDPRYSATSSCGEAHGKAHKPNSEKGSPAASTDGRQNADKPGSEPDKDSEGTSSGEEDLIDLGFEETVPASRSSVAVPATTPAVKRQPELMTGDITSTPEVAQMLRFYDQIRNVEDLEMAKKRAMDLL